MFAAVSNVNPLHAVFLLYYMYIACSVCWECGAARRGSHNLNTEHAKSGILTHGLSHSYGGEQPLRYMCRRCLPT